jgi:hypothetical protein
VVGEGEGEGEGDTDCCYELADLLQYTKHKSLMPSLAHQFIIIYRMQSAPNYTDLSI